MNKRLLLPLVHLIFSSNCLVVLGQTVPPVFHQYVKQTEAFQDSLIFGTEFRAERNMLFMNGEKLKRIFKIKIYDRNNWIVQKIMEGREFVVGKNDRYMFLVEKGKNGAWKQLGVPMDPKTKGLEKSYRSEFDILSPLISLNGLSLLEDFNHAEKIENVKITKGDLDDLRFDYYDSRFKEEGCGPVQVHVEFYDVPFRYIVLFEKVLKNYKPEISLTSYRSVQKSNAGELESISVNHEIKTIATQKVEQREQYLLKDFKPAEKLKDNYLGFYGIAEPAHLIAATPWYLSYWSLGGALLIFLGGLGFWIQRNRA